ncbi:MAG: hypothetical protein H7644_07930 [Candidatus Heimdallarchaeota archaeon]|nr:hypothetical protein [Candidatus Heimdallarchaeota archaeon]MCK5143681.1 hypothetical protein [Candidatus Heimdallarchaeota archaeon]
MIQAVYIISRTGLPIVVVDKGDENSSFSDQALFSGIMTAIQAAMEEIDVGTPKFVDTRKFEIFIELSDNIAVALLRKVHTDVERSIIHEITAEILGDISSKFPNISDYNLLTEEQIEEIEHFVEEMMKKGDKEIAQRKATKIVSDSFW